MISKNEIQHFMGAKAPKGKRYPKGGKKAPTTKAYKAKVAKAAAKGLFGPKNGAKAFGKKRGQRGLAASLGGGGGG
jgi:hypothetical protein